MMVERKCMILWLDDEPHYTATFADVISADGRFQLIRERDVDVALDLIARTDFKPDLLIWDVILPPGRLGLEQTRNGLDTGEFFYIEFRRRFPKVPAILFTNVSRADVHRRFNSENGKSSAWRKRDLLPEELLGKIKQALGIPENDNTNME